jgi:myosin heavy subunit
VRREIAALSAAAHLIQVKWRAHSWHVSQKDSATEIQRIFRGYSCRSAFKRSIQSALRLQKIWRGKMARSDLQRNHFAATVLQCVWRKFSAQLNYHLDLLEIVIVQSAVRSWYARRKASQRRIAALTIQKIARKHQAVCILQQLREEKLERECVVAATVFCQVGVMMTFCLPRFC